jgi:hypothetical protein
MEGWSLTPGIFQTMGWSPTFTVLNPAPACWGRTLTLMSYAAELNALESPVPAVMRDVMDTEVWEIRNTSGQAHPGERP